MSDRVGYPLAVHLLVRSGDDVLFTRRANTNYEAGRLSLPAGHVEQGESARAALQREALEELKIDLPSEQPVFVLVQHKRDPVDLAERVDLFFEIEIGDYTPTIGEPEKCSELVWANRFALPPDVVSYVRFAIHQINDGSAYAEYNW